MMVASMMLVDILYTKKVSDHMYTTEHGIVFQIINYAKSIISLSPYPISSDQLFHNQILSRPRSQF